MFNQLMSSIISLDKKERGNTVYDYLLLYEKELDLLWICFIGLCGQLEH